MSHIDIIRLAPQITLQCEAEKHSLMPDSSVAIHEDIRIELVQQADTLQVFLTAETTPVSCITLRWAGGASQGARILGDAWERGYGDLEWRGIVPERIMPWYMLIADDGGVHGYGVETAPAAMCYWRCDHHHLCLTLDVRNGGSGVLLSGRRMLAATIVSRSGIPGESAYEAARDFCSRMCRNPRLPKQLVYGSNNWYYAYGNSSQQKIMQDAQLLAELTEGIAQRPYMVIDDGWQISHTCSCSGGPWDRSNYLFPDMAGLAADIKALGLHPGVWCRPLTTYAAHPWACYLNRPTSDGARLLDPSHPLVLAEVEEMARHLTSWGYELIKHDFSTYDIFGRWGFDMGNILTDSGWHFYDRSKTTAEIILDLYRAIRKGAGDNVVIIGCNTVSHLAAGLFELQRTGDDTSGLEWERTRKMGVNTLAFRMPQHGTFYAADADCVGITGKVDWTLNREWLRLLSLSGTPLFISIDPAVLTDEQKRCIRESYRTFAANQTPAIPLDWMETTCPETWLTMNGIDTFDFHTED